MKKYVLMIIVAVFAIGAFAYYGLTMGNNSSSQPTNEQLSTNGFQESNHSNAVMDDADYYHPNVVLDQVNLDNEASKKKQEILTKLEEEERKHLERGEQVP